MTPTFSGSKPFSSFFREILKILNAFFMLTWMNAVTAFSDSSFILSTIKHQLSVLWTDFGHFFGKILKILSSLFTLFKQTRWRRFRICNWQKIINILTSIFGRWNTFSPFSWKNFENFRLIFHVYLNRCGDGNFGFLVSRRLSRIWHQFSLDLNHSNYFFGKILKI